MNSKKHSGKLMRKILLFFAVTVLLLISGITVYSSKNVDYVADEALFSSARSGNITKFYYDASGNYGSDISEYLPEEMECLHSGVMQKQWYSFDSISDNVKAAFIAAEDRNFYSHRGINFKRTLGAAINYFVHYGADFGGSTITQQVIKNISGDNERTMKRKVNEIFRAFHLESNHSKNEIFEVYLNIIPYGENVCGVGLAAKKYFGKEPSELTIAEAATLVGMANAPTRYNPYTNYEACLEKRNVIIGAMRECGFISEAQLRLERDKPITLVERESGEGRINSWFVETTCDELCRDLMKKYSYSYETARVMVMSGGLSVYTTADLEAQRIVTEYFENSQNFSDDISNGLNYSMVICDSTNADLRAIVGGVGEKKANRVMNYATVPITPASTLKPLALYAPLLNSKKITWSTVFDDVPVSFTQNEAGEYTEFPKNSPAVYDGLITVSKAIAYSKNTVAVRLYNMLGAERIYNNLYENYGFNTLVRSKKTASGSVISDLAPSPLALGQLSYGIPLRNLTEAYTVFSSEGRLYSGRSYVLCLDNRGNTLIKKEQSSKRIYLEECARVMNQLLMRVTEEGTASKITLKNIIDVAGKTGTSGGNRDKLFIGYTPYYTAGIWCGYSNRTESIGKNARSQLSVWDDVMKALHESALEKEEQILSFSVKNLVYAPYCMDSGKAYTPTCLKDARGGRMEYGYFIRTTEPKEMCDRHISVRYDMFLGGVAVNPTFKGFIGEVALINVPNRSFPKQIFVTDAQYVYRDMRGIKKIPESVELPYFAYALPEGEYAGISNAKRQFNSANIYRR